MIDMSWWSKNITKNVSKVTKNISDVLDDVWNVTANVFDPFGWVGDKRWLKDGSAAPEMEKTPEQAKADLEVTKIDEIKSNTAEDEAAKRKRKKGMTSTIWNAGGLKQKLGGE